MVRISGRQRARGNNSGFGMGWRRDTARERERERGEDCFQMKAQFVQRNFYYKNTYSNLQELNSV